VAARRDHQRGAGVTEVVEGELGYPHRARSRLERSAHEVMTIEEQPGRRRKDQAVLIRCADELLLAEQSQRVRTDIDSTATGRGLRKRPPLDAGL